MKLKVNDVVTILPYKDDPRNCRGRINLIDKEKGYYVSNMNMPFMGSVSGWFKKDQLKA